MIVSLEIFVLFFLLFVFLQTMESLNGGKPFLQAFYVDLQGVIKTLRYYAGWADKIHGMTIPVGMCCISLLKHEFTASPAPSKRQGTADSSKEPEYITNSDSV